MDSPQMQNVCAHMQIRTTQQSRMRIAILKQRLNARRSHFAIQSLN